MLPAAFGAAIYQINIFIGTILASLLPAGSVSYLYYADRIVELPLGVFAIAVGTATLPSFSEQVAQGQIEELKRTISFSLRLILFITIPATVALIALRVPIISVLFQRGEFGVQSTLLTAQALLCYAVGLWAFSVIRIIVSAFYSLQDTRSPMKAAIVALIVNAALQRRPDVPPEARGNRARHLHRLGGECGNALGHPEAADRNRSWTASSTRPSARPPSPRSSCGG